jgi:putative FmdB family regulatory protein
MPNYEFRCQKCGQLFEETQSVSEHERSKRERTLSCPACGSVEVAAQIGIFEVQTSAKS